jgi:hypothetical protein
VEKPEPPKTPSIRVYAVFVSLLDSEEDEEEVLEEVPESDDEGEADDPLFDDVDDERLSVL